MTAPSPQRAASAEERELGPVPPPSMGDLHAAVRECIGETIPLRRRWVSAIMKRVVRPLLDRITAAEARAEEAERHATHWQIKCQGTRSLELAATADRDRLADDVARLRGACTHYEKAFDELWGGYSAAAEDEITAARALTATGGTTDGQA